MTFVVVDENESAFRYEAESIEDALTEHRSQFGDADDPPILAVFVHSYGDVKGLI